MKILQSLLTSASRKFLERGIVLQRSSPDFDAELELEKIWPKSLRCDLVRVGSQESDGGYLLPSALLEPDRVFSPGVSNNMTFEQYFLDKGIPCVLADGSIEEPPIKHPLVQFDKLWVKGESKSSALSLDEWVNRYSAEGENLILQMDIEGDEYSVILAASKSTLCKFTVIVMELHDLSSVASRFGQIAFHAFLNKIRDTHEVVHAHPNNCCPGLQTKNGLTWPDVMELTLVRKDLGIASEYWAELPHALDRNNTTSNTFELTMPAALKRPQSEI